MSIQASPVLSNLYHALAECLSEPLDWFAGAGKDWELYQFARTLSHDIMYPPLEKAVVELESIPAESFAQRKKRYRSLINGSTTEPVAIYESLALEGRLHGATTFHVWTLYRAAGLNINGAELPDHASIELAFLAYLVRQEMNSTRDKGQWHRARREFIKQHAKKWLPALGQTIARTADPVYRSIGLVLTALIQAETIPRRRQSSRTRHPLPGISSRDDCTLCSFCAQVCPTQAIIVSETHDMTSLQIMDNKCVSCNKCVRICPAHILQLDTLESSKGIRKLYESPRERCPGCDIPTVSRAEVDAIADQLGTHPRWLDYCSDCRIVFGKELR